ncbi:hypothetical protein KMC56_gp29 [Achromobacter phage vB_AxyP_19-32_Axy12]|uniref:Uncharacterized protein n=1 Tax=Achromobacter phage vB_AxyP_19-32_Axy12 TaxID=2591043 RepID=A0A514CUJ7_9CAUD|nr:hypothetical protein KMC56_gp29 [Achromobacter phage vB_AxyP_19-32_Axy12]QDH84148.1 hypothetical protein Axy12_029 [Achromobacter phage vB_AxyP_19-32_Axy12]
MNSAALQIELQAALNQLGKLTRSGATSEAALKQAKVVVQIAQYLANAIGAELVHYQQATKRG